MRRDGDRLRDILDCVRKIEKYAARGAEAFAGDELVRTFIIHHLQIIGEAVFKISPEFKARHSGVPWPQIAGMRHVLVHDYFVVDPDMVWGMVERDLPELKSKVEALLAESQTELG